jgi:pimeloyl-ACP methyl ester carboxylesterase
MSDIPSPAIPPHSELRDEDFLRAAQEGSRAGLISSVPLAASVIAQPGELLEILTPGGVLLGLLAGPAQATGGVLLLGGAVGGFGGPGGRAYHALASRLRGHGLASLRLHCRDPEDLESCVQDALLALHWWSTQGISRVVTVGHSLGGATAIVTAAFSPQVAGVATLATQTAGTESVDRLDGRPILLLHGREDLVLPPFCSENVYARAEDPKELVLIDGCGHGMAEAVDEVVDRVEAFAAAALTRAAGAST